MELSCDKKRGKSADNYDNNDNKKCVPNSRIHLFTFIFHQLLYRAELIIVLLTHDPGYMMLPLLLEPNV